MSTGIITLVVMGIVVLVTFGFIAALSILNTYRENLRLKEELNKTATHLQELGRKTHSFLWNVGNQREKVPGSLLSLLESVYPLSDKNHRYKIKDKIMENIK